MKRLFVALLALLVVLFAAPAASAQGELKDLQVEIQAPGVRYPGEWFDVTIKVTNPNRVDTFFHTSIWFDNPDVVGDYTVSWVSPDTRVRVRECNTEVVPRGCIFDWAGELGWEQYKLLTFKVRAGNAPGTQGFIYVVGGQGFPVWPTLIKAEKSITIASPPEPAEAPSQPAATPTPAPSQGILKVTSVCTWGAPQFSFSGGVPYPNDRFPMGLWVVVEDGTGVKMPISFYGSQPGYTAQMSASPIITWGIRGNATIVPVSGRTYYLRVYAEPYALGMPSLNTPPITQATLFRIC